MINQYPKKILAVDFETTGLVSVYDSPTAVGMVLFDDGEPVDELFIRIIPGKKCKLSLEAFFVQAGDIDRLDVDALTKAILKIFSPDAVPAKDAMSQIAAWARRSGAAGCPNVAQNASFDWGFFANQLAVNTTAYEGCPLSPVWICTKAMAQSVWPQQNSIKQTSLDSVIAKLGVPTRDGSAHDALEDARLAGRVYFALRKEIEGCLLKTGL